MKGVVRQMKETGWKKGCTFAGEREQWQCRAHARERAIWMRGWRTDRRRCTTRFEEESVCRTVTQTRPSGKQAMEKLVREQLAGQSGTYRDTWAEPDGLGGC